MSRLRSVAILPAVVGLLIATAGPVHAERFPSPGPGAGGPFATTVRAEVSGTARLGTASTLTARVTLVAPSRVTAVVSVAAAGRTCSTSRTLFAGARSIAVRCPATPTSAHLAGLPVTVRLRTTTAGTGRSSTHTMVRRVPVDDGPALTSAAALTRWRALAARLGVATAAGSDSTHTAAYLAQRVSSTAQDTGWSSPATAAALSELLALQNPDGGFGLAVAWDAFQDGTVNPASTSYTVTTAGHVGWPLLAAYREGAVGPVPLERAVDSLLDSTARLEDGTCLAYSTSPDDAHEPCVHNVNIGAAAFLAAVSGATSYRRDELRALVAAVSSRLTRGYDRATGYWVYMSGRTAPQDMSHQIYTATSADALDESFGAVSRMMARPWWRQPGGRLQPRSVVASSMISVAGRDCRYARSPGVLLGIERAAGSSAAAFSTASMSRTARAVIALCFAPGAQNEGRIPAAVPAPPPLGLTG